MGFYWVSYFFQKFLVTLHHTKLQACDGDEPNGQHHLLPHRKDGEKVSEELLAHVDNQMCHVDLYVTNRKARTCQ